MSSLKKRIAVMSGALLAVALVAVSCGGAEPTATPPPTSTTAPPTATSVPPTATRPAATTPPSTPTQAPPTATVVRPTSTPAATPTPAPKRGGILTSRSLDDSGSGDMYDSRLSTNGGVSRYPAYNTLIRMDRQTHTRPIPALAESWTVSPDGKSYTFKLRQNVKFSDGSPFTADDVVFSLNRIVNPPSQVAPGVPFTLLSVIGNVTKADPQTVTVSLKSADAAFLTKLAFVYNVMMSKKVVEPVDQAGKSIADPQIIGTGPFVFKSHEPNVSWAWLPNPNYWDKDAAGNQLPFVGEYRVFIVVDDSAGFSAFRTKQVLLAGNADRGVPPQFVNVVLNQMKGKASVQFARGVQTQGIKTINTTKAPYSDANVRRALSMIMNRDDLATFYRAGGPPDLVSIGGPLDPQSPWGIPLADLLKFPGYDATKKAADVAKAKDLLKAAGIPDGFEVKILTSAGASQTAAEAYAAQLAQAGLKGSLEILSFTAATQRELAADFLVEFRARGFTMEDPSAILDLRARTNGVENYGKYSNPKVDSLLDQALAELDVAKRTALYRQVQEILIDEVPYANAYWVHYAIGLWDSVKNLYYGPTAWNGWADMDAAWLDES